MKDSAKGRIDYLDGLRGVAILAVILFHAYARWPEFYPYKDQFLGNPLVGTRIAGVNLFFVISGFVILMTLKKCNWFFQFMLKRWERLFPAMFFCSLLAFAFAKLFPGRPAGPANSPDLLPGLTFLGADTFDIPWIHAWFHLQPRNLEGAFWSLFVEVRFYCLFGLLFFLVGETRSLIALALLFLMSQLGAVSWAAHFFLDRSLTFSGKWFEDYAWVREYFHFETYGFFFMGAMLYRFHLSRNFRLLAVAVLFGVLASIGANAPMWADLFFVFLISAVLLSTFLKRVFSAGLFTFVGFVSYPLYLFHENAMVVLIVRLGKIAPWIPGCLLPILPIAALMGVAYLVAKYLEPVGKSWCQTLVKKLPEWHWPALTASAPPAASGAAKRPAPKASADSGRLPARGVSAHFVPLLVILGICFFFCAGQEILTIRGTYDDLYFLLRSANWSLSGNHLAPIKEVLYPAVIHFSRFLGLSLHTFEVAAYAMGCYLLWTQVARTVGARWVAWVSVLPLLAFSVQQSVFERATSDALELILAPLSLATALAILASRASRSSLLLGAGIAAAQMLTRPEGFGFLLPPLAALGWVAFVSERRTHWWRVPGRYWKGLVLLLGIPFGVQQAACASNYVTFGFWAPTVMDAREVRDVLRDLESIQPSEQVSIDHVPVPKSSLEMAYAASPAFARTRAYFDANSGGNGLSHSVYSSTGGNPDGGHFQWALWNAASSVAGENPRACLDFLGQVAEELKAAFDRGTLPRRRIWFPPFGPQFSPVSPAYGASLKWIGDELLDGGEIPTPNDVPGEQKIPDEDFDRMALRQSGVFPEGGISGWVADGGLGVPRRIHLDEAASSAGIALEVLLRPDVVHAVMRPKFWKSEALCGFRLHFRALWTGNLIVDYPKRSVSIPLAGLYGKPAVSGIEADGVHLQIDSVAVDVPSHSIVVKTGISRAVFVGMRYVCIFSLALFAVALVLGGRLPGWNGDSMRAALGAVGCLVLPLVLFRWLLFSAIDSCLFPGSEYRYAVSGIFFLWFFGAFGACAAAHWLLSDRDSGGV